jgi:hypothetical protein
MLLTIILLYGGAVTLDTCCTSSIAKEYIWRNIYLVDLHVQQQASNKSCHRQETDHQKDVWNIQI